MYITLATLTAVTALSRKGSKDNKDTKRLDLSSAKISKNQDTILSGILMAIKFICLMNRNFSRQLKILTGIVESLWRCKIEGTSIFALSKLFWVKTKQMG